MNFKLSKIFWIGFLVLFTSVLFFYGVRFLQDETFQNSMFTFKIVYKDAQGIDSGDDVQMLRDIYGYQIYNRNNEEVDSCWEFYGIDSCLKEAQSIVDSKIKTEM